MTAQILEGDSVDRHQSAVYCAWPYRTHAPHRMNWLDECEQEAKALTQEKRQEFLNHIWAGKTLGEARELASVTFNAANGIMRMNINEMLYLKRETV